ncbi:thioredoxin family protein [Senegalia massiliensis]|jgi:small redox-active disulfide protein 2|uniref:Thioredoxin family protein n=1 Tax=Senegalia massiliensis TaxID=1720316 RepID=A0A845QWM7_9CLOT|nr:thioredoxin family protein [Senegalia massiliensis]NBI06394.1 thioredoxin family protein [Senegalia massiliensis]
MKIKVLGSGCAKCDKVVDNVKEAVKELKIDAEVEKVTEVQEIMKYGVMKTPALVIDEKVISSGKVNKAKEIIKYIEKER